MSSLYGKLDTAYYRLCLKTRVVKWQIKAKWLSACYRLAYKRDCLYCRLSYKQGRCHHRMCYTGKSHVLRLTLGRALTEIRYTRDIALSELNHNSTARISGARNLLSRL